MKQEHLEAIEKRLIRHKTKMIKLYEEVDTGKKKNHSLVYAILWNYFGFPETQIANFESDDFLIVYKNETEQYGVFILDYLDEIPPSLTMKHKLLAKKYLLKKIVLTNGKGWSQFEFNNLPPLIESKVASFTFDFKRLNLNLFVDHFKPFLSESQELESTIDYYNKKRWIGFRDANSNHARFMILSVFELYSNLSERVYVPLLDDIFWSDEPFIARDKARAAVSEYLLDTFQTNDLGTSFEMVAFKSEEKALIENFPLQK